MQIHHFRISVKFPDADEYTAFPYDFKYVPGLQLNIDMGIFKGDMLAYYEALSQVVSLFSSPVDYTQYFFDGIYYRIDKISLTSA